jgi:hypothetical protein
MRKLFALTLLALTLAGGFAFVGIELPTPAKACPTSTGNC